VEKGSRVFVAYPDGGPQIDVAAALEAGLPPTPLANTPVDCNVEYACQQCLCTYQACDRGRPNILSFDLNIQDGEANGNASNLGTVHLKPQ
jgi:hypothetical protein